MTTTALCYTLKYSYLHPQRLFLYLFLYIAKFHLASYLCATRSSRKTVPHSYLYRQFCKLFTAFRFHQISLLLRLVELGLKRSLNLDCTLLCYKNYLLYCISLFCEKKYNLFRLKKKIKSLDVLVTTTASHKYHHLHSE